MLSKLCATSKQCFAACSKQFCDLSVVRPAPDIRGYGADMFAPYKVIVENNARTTPAWNSEGEGTTLASTSQAPVWNFEGTTLVSTLRTVSSPTFTVALCT
ncbi:hypothetical protein PG994_008082 [Apiospora phragmitis]|uniref:Uncharacterized protein n=1 Tax=Apiospora phragmitis TaxID=2905665 RepID=A0ABR1UUG0_9PEZI